MKSLEDQASRRPGRIRAWLRRLGRRGPADQARRDGGPGASQIAFGLMYDRFRELLALNNVALEMFADLEERLSGRKPFAMDAVAQRIRKAALDVFVMAKDLNQIAGGRHAGLYDALHRINVSLEAELAAHHPPAGGPLVVPLAELRASDGRTVGQKMASLGEVAGLGLRVPEGFAVSSGAFVRFMSESDLWRRTDRLETILEADGPRALGEACQEVEQAIRRAELPAELAEAILRAHDERFPGGASLAVRSSAIGEDRASASHAGLYRTLLRVSREGLLDAYREVVASAFSAAAVAYRYDRGLTGYEAAMGVGCLRLVEARVAGILFSRPPDDTGADRVIISATPGLAAGLAAGEQGAEMLVVPAAGGGAGASLLSPDEVHQLGQAARRLEEHFGSPQDIEWAVDQAGTLHILQTRPLVASPRPAGAPLQAESGARPLLIGGATACPGVGSGRVARVRDDSELDAVPDGAVLVSRYSTPRLARIMRRCAAIVTDVGSPTGHMAILAREYRVPSIVGLEGATRTLQVGQTVTVDATSRCIYDGALAVAPAVDDRPPLLETPALQMLQRVARLVTPLRLTDPAAPDFSPQAAGSLHDLTRFIHEKAFEVMFHYGDLAAADRQNSFKLKAVLPIDVLIFDVGGGIDPALAGTGRVTPEQIRSVPMRAFLSGLQDERIRWDQPRPVSMRGFLSVLGESISAPPAESQRLGRASYAILSDRYMNFSTKAGYHFSTVDTFCEKSLNKNYVHFRFAGGAADEARRARRVRFLAAVLGALHFKVSARQDLLVARLDKVDEEQTARRLADLGRLTLCVRQLDMLMSSDAVADEFARWFLEGQWNRF